MSGDETSRADPDFDQAARHHNPDSRRDLRLAFVRPAPLGVQEGTILQARILLKMLPHLAADDGAFGHGDGRQCAFSSAVHALLYSDEWRASSRLTSSPPHRAAGRMSPFAASGFWHSAPRNVLGQQCRKVRVRITVQHSLRILVELIIWISLLVGAHGQREFPMSDFAAIWSAFALP
jgi:hypothetical protein